MLKLREAGESVWSRYHGGASPGIVGEGNESATLVVTLIEAAPKPDAGAIGRFVHLIQDGENFSLPDGGG